MRKYIPSDAVHIAGLPVVDADVEAAIDLIWEDVRRREGRVYALINGYSAKLRRDEPAYASAIEDPRVVPLPDGVPLSIGARLLGLRRVRRCPGPDLMDAACKRASETGLRFYLLGGDEGVAQELERVLTRRYPGICITGSATPPHGEWSAEENMQLAAQVVGSGADVLWLGVSAPKQETWALEQGELLAGIPVVCVGAAFDFLSGRKPRAPRVWRRLGLEWLFRLGTEPRRLWRRYLMGNAVFIRDLCVLRGRETPGGSAVDKAS